MELTVCFETSFEAAKAQKEAKYSELAEEVEENGYTVDLLTLEVGSRGFVSFESSARRLRHQTKICKGSYET